MNTYISGLAIFFSISVAHAATYEPIKCPNMEYISAQPLDLAVEIGNNLWGVSAFNQMYDTDTSWNFSILNVRAGSTAHALTMGNEVLSTFKYQYGPMIYPPINRFVCYYKSQYGYEAHAVAMEREPSIN